jgi:hypothetical protein
MAGGRSLEFREIPVSGTDDIIEVDELAPAV